MRRIVCERFEERKCISEELHFSIVALAPTYLLSISWRARWAHCLPCFCSAKILKHCPQQKVLTSRTKHMPDSAGHARIGDGDIALCRYVCLRSRVANSMRKCKSCGRVSQCAERLNFFHKRTRFIRSISDISTITKCLPVNNCCFYRDKHVNLYHWKNPDVKSLFETRIVPLWHELTKHKHVGLEVTSARVFRHARTSSSFLFRTLWSWRQPCAVQSDLIWIRQGPLELPWLVKLHPESQETKGDFFAAAFFRAGKNTIIPNENNVLFLIWCSWIFRPPFATVVVVDGQLWGIVGLFWSSHSWTLPHWGNTNLINDWPTHWVRSSPAKAVCFQWRQRLICPRILFPIKLGWRPASRLS